MKKRPTWLLATFVVALLVITWWANSRQSTYDPSKIVVAQGTPIVLAETFDSVRVRRAQGLRDEYFARYRAWRGGVPVDPRQDKAWVAQQESERICTTVVGWYLAQAYAKLNPEERRAFLERRGQLVALHGSTLRFNLRLEPVPTTLNRDSLLARYDELLMPGADEPPPWENAKPDAARDSIIAQYRRELVDRGLALEPRPLSVWKLRSKGVTYIPTQ